MPPSDHQPPMPFPGSEHKRRYHCQVRSYKNSEKLEELTVEAQSKEEAINQLHKDGYLLVKIEAAGEAGSKSKGLFESIPFLAMFQRFLLRGKTDEPEENESETSILSSKAEKRQQPFQLFPNVGTTQLISFAVQLSALLEAGVPLIRSLQVVQKGVKNPYFEQILESCIEEVSHGFSFGYAVGKYPKVFPPIWANLIEVGEASGKLAGVLKEIAHYQESAARIKSKVISAFFYPTVLLVFATAATIFLLLKIIPKFEEIFKGFHIKMPQITVFVINVSHIVRNYFPILVIGVVVLVIGIAYLVRTKTGRFVFDLVRLKAPIMGTLLLQVAIVRFTRSLSTLIKAGIPILQALEIAGKIAENAVVEEMIHEAHDAVQVGHPLGPQLEAKKLFPVFMTQLTSVGEETGELDRFLDMIANFYEERVDTFLARLSVMIEPLLLILMGAIIGTLVIAMFLPIIEISTGGH